MPYTHHNLPERECVVCKGVFKPQGAAHIRCLICIPNRAWATRFYNFGITKPIFLEMLEAQEGMCAVCENPLPDVLTKICIDHCHETGKVRGLVHNKCNLGLHYVEDSEFLSAAMKYIEKHKMNEGV